MCAKVFFLWCGRFGGAKKQKFLWGCKLIDFGGCFELTFVLWSPGGPENLDGVKFKFDRNLHRKPSSIPHRTISINPLNEIQFFSPILLWSVILFVCLLSQGCCTMYMCIENQTIFRLKREKNQYIWITYRKLIKHLLSLIDRAFSHLQSCSVYMSNHASKTNDLFDGGFVRCGFLGWNFVSVKERGKKLVKLKLLSGEIKKHLITYWWWKNEEKRFSSSSFFWQTFGKNCSTSIDLENFSHFCTFLLFW